MPSQCHQRAKWGTVTVDISTARTIKPVRNTVGFSLTVGQRNAVRQFINRRLDYKTSNDVVMAVLNGETLALPEVDDTLATGCIWGVRMSSEELAALDEAAREKEQSWSAYLRERLFVEPEAPVEEPQAIPDIADTVSVDDDVEGEEAEVDGSTDNTSPETEEKTATTAGFSMTAGQKDAVRAFIKTSDAYKHASDILIALLLGEEIHIPVDEKASTEKSTYPVQMLVEDKEALDALARSKGLNTSAYVRRELFGETRTIRKPRTTAPKQNEPSQKESIPEQEATVETASPSTTDVRTDAVPAITEPVSPTPVGVSTPASEPLRKGVVHPASLLDEAYDLNTIYSLTMEQVPSLLRKFDEAADEEAISRCLEEITDYANMYTKFSVEPSSFWRTLLRTADSIQLPTSAYHRLLLWAGTLETGRLSYMH